ncbi:class A beta-lactamase-related serine hydrolase [Actinophytocola gossypii]|uniref:class A beta-lactamase-related serine hydrolase n=1 Tax=Actinophytocola gossypii TaxID=2812003 RepID=UPI0021A4D893|nr:class A beta-lactamase-related serine hydrolase [Actinophytocola gossypii]
MLVAAPLTLAVGCGAVTAGPPEPVQPAPRAAVEPRNQPGVGPRTTGAAAVERAATEVEPNTIVGAVVLDRASGGRPLAINADRQFRSASLVKLLIAIDALERGADGEDRRRLYQMLELSDDGLASEYWVRGGGPDIVVRTSAELGLTGTMPPEVRGQWGEVLVTPADVVRIYEYILDMPTADRALVVDALASAPRVAADGFDQHFGIPDGLGMRWAIKQGWGNNDLAMVLHSTGLAGRDWRYLVVLLTEHPLGSDWGKSANSVTAAAKALHDLLPKA